MNKREKEHRKYLVRRKHNAEKRAENIRRQYKEMSKKNLKPGFIIDTLQAEFNCSRACVYSAINVTSIKKRHTGSAGGRPVGEAQ